MDSDTLQLVNLGLTIAIAVATVWIAFAANQISKRQQKMDFQRQKLEWCRTCLQAISEAVTLADHTHSEITEKEFRLCRRTLRAQIISLKNEGELFLVPFGSKPKQVSCLKALKSCFNAMDEEEFMPPQATPSPHQLARDNILSALNDFRTAMQDDFGNVWADHNRK